MSYFSNGQTNNVVISQSSTSLFAESMPSSEWLASIKTVTQTELFQEVAGLLEEIFQAIILAGYTPLAPDQKWTARKSKPVCDLAKGVL